MSGGGGVVFNLFVVFVLLTTTDFKLKLGLNGVYKFKDHTCIVFDSIYS